MMNIPFVASNSSTLDKLFPLASTPPTISTRPLFRRVARCEKRAAFIIPVTENVWATGSYNSALANGPLPPLPPASRTTPPFSNVAVWAERAAVMAVGVSVKERVEKL